MIGQTRSGSYLLFGVNSGVWLSFDSLREGVKVVVFHDAIDSVVQPRKTPPRKKWNSIQFPLFSFLFHEVNWQLSTGAIKKRLALLDFWSGTMIWRGSVGPPGELKWKESNNSRRCGPRMRRSFIVSNTEYPRTFFYLFFFFSVRRNSTGCLPSSLFIPLCWAGQPTQQQQQN